MLRRALSHLATPQALFVISQRLSRRSFATVSPEQVIPTLKKHILVDGYHHVMDLDKSHGVRIYDAAGKREILDCYASFATLPIGYNHPKMVNDQAFLKRLMSAAITKPANSDIYTTDYADFVQTFASVVPEQYRSHLFFISGGALAVENALKVAFDWKVKKNFRKGYSKERGHQIIHFQEAFHGRSGYTMSLTNTDPAKTALYPKFSWPRVPNPKIRFYRGQITPQENARLDAAEAKALEAIRQAAIDNPDDIAALIIEPIQSEGGDNHFRPSFLKQLRKLADEYDFLLIFDEVQTGFGTTGRWWCLEHFADAAVAPDIVSFAKKAQASGIFANRRIDEIPDNVFVQSSRINSTWGGSLVDMVRCIKIIEIIRADDLLRNAERVGRALLDGLVRLEEKYEHTGVCNARGRGLLAALSMPSTEVRNRAVEALGERGVLVLKCGPDSLRFRPALVITEKDVAEILNRMDEVFAELLKKK